MSRDHAGVVFLFIELCLLNLFGLASVLGDRFARGEISSTNLALHGC